MKFVIVDISNLVHRSKHVIKNYDDFDDCVGMVLTIVFNSLKKSYDKFNADHCVACFDSYSWRRDYYDGYKANRREIAKEYTPKQIQEGDIIKKVLVELKEFLRNFTNVTVLDGRSIEADDFISRWVQLHGDDIFEHIIISADSDFKQLVRENIELYNPLSNTLFTLNGVFFQDGKRSAHETCQRYSETWKVKLNKFGEPERFDPEWELFKKCIRGDASDNIKSAFPRVPEKRMRLAFANRGGLEWNNLINTTWGPPASAPEEEPRSVRALYEFNRRLIDLTNQPQEIKDQMDQTIASALTKEKKQLVGAYFAKFCQKYRLEILLRQSQVISHLLAAPYDQ